ncbi:MAG: hypothetical protein AAF489_12510 [Bacteroidota bacterium]
MENSPREIEKLTTEWVEEAGIEQPSLDFVHNVMEVIEASTTKQKVYRPLISGKGWSLVAGLFVAILAVVYLLPAGEAPLFKALDWSGLPSLQNPFENLQVSKPMLYAIGFLTLFLVQIPFLKRKFIN